jgi:hypothetical protein
VSKETSQNQNEANHKYLAKCVTGGSVLLVFGIPKFPEFEATKWVDLSAVAVALTMGTPPVMQYYSQKPCSFHLTYCEEITEDNAIISSLLKSLNNNAQSLSDFKKVLMEELEVKKEDLLNVQAVKNFFALIGILERL